MENDFLQPIPYDKLKPISFEQAKELVNLEMDIEVLLMAIYNQVTKKGMKISKFANEHFFKEGRNPIGKLHKGKIPIICPFHETENDDSTSVLKKAAVPGKEPRPDFVKCFTGGCKASKAVTAVNLYMIFVLGVDPNVVGSAAASSQYGQTIHALSKFLGYRIVNGSKRKLTKKEEKELRKQKLMADATEIYHQEFLANKTAQDYFLKERGFQYSLMEPMELIKKLKVGYAPQAFPSTYLFDKLAPHYKLEEMIDASLVNWFEFNNGGGKTNSVSDFHSDGLIMPYWSKNKVVKHYSRGINAPKKWRHLRGAGISDEPLNFYEGTRYEVVNIIEGELSWGSMLALLYANSISTYGTNGLSEEHIEMLVKVREDSNGAFCKTINIVYDGDEPGRAAAVRTGKLLVEKGFDVRVVILPDGKDPNDILKEYKENAKAIMEKCFSEAVSYYTFLALNAISKEVVSVADRLVEMTTIKKMIEEHGLTDAVQLYMVAKEFGEIAKIPVDVIWESWKPKENKNIEILSTEKFAFLTNDLEGYYLTKFALQGRAAYIEDTTFSFLNEQELTVKSIVADEKFYSDKEKEEIKEFCQKNSIKFLTFFDFKTICEVNVNSKSLIGSILKS